MCKPGEEVSTTEGAAASEDTVKDRLRKMGSKQAIEERLSGEERHGMGGWSMVKGRTEAKPTH